MRAARGLLHGVVLILMQRFVAASGRQPKDAGIIGVA